MRMKCPECKMVVTHRPDCSIYRKALQEAKKILVDLPPASGGEQLVFVISKLFNEDDVTD